MPSSDLLTSATNTFYGDMVHRYHDAQVIFKNFQDRV